MSMIDNERTKLTATYLNGVAIAVLAVGGFAPVVNVTNVQSTVTGPVMLSAAICLFISAALHLIARTILKGLKQ